MSKKRVHELAKELGMENREAVQALQAAGVDVKTHSSSVYEEEAMGILRKAQGKDATPSAASRRPGMFIVKKKRDAEAEAAEAEAAAAAAAPPAQPARAASAEPQHVPAASAGLSAPSEASAPSHEGPATLAASEPAIPMAPAAAFAAPPSERHEPAAPAAAAGPEAPAAASAPPAEPERPMPKPLQEVTMPRRGDGPFRRTYERPAASAEGQGPRAEGADGKASDAAPPLRAPGAPGSATVVRMIDRDKLLERVPGRRLGGGPTGPRYGQVTELKVVTDPFGRGREMVQVGANKRKGPAAGPARTGPAARKGPAGRGGKRDSMDARERSMHPSRLKKKKSGGRSIKKTEVTQKKESKRVIRMKETIAVADLAHQLGVKAVDIIRRLMALGTMVTQNQSIDFDTATLMAGEFEYKVESVAFAEDSVIEQAAAKKDDTGQVTRPPVVTVMGHVDHGKTSLLDVIRKTRVVSGEAGGITQHIGAYSVPVAGGKTVTFLDTPGHAAFTNMRARGAKVTDFVVLVVAADDGVMPQTEEAIRHAQAAQVPIIVAVNKVDKPDANPDRVMQELTKFSLVPEAWGGDTMFVNTSALNGDGVSELLETISLQAEVHELTADPTRPAVGVVIEAELDKGRGPVATVLVQRGTLRRGDAVVVGCASGKVRAMMDATGKQMTAVGPSMAVEITGLDAVPDAGDVLNAVENAESAREVASHRQEQRRVQEQTGSAASTLDDLMKRMGQQEQLELKVVLKADVQGSAEAVRGALEKLSTDEVKVNVIYAGVGGIKESDIMLAAASGGLVLGFGVRPDTSSRQISERERVEVRTYNIIYEALDDMRKAMEGLLTPESREKIVGRAEVRELFRVTKVGTIGGCRVTDGKAQKSSRVRVLRDSVQVYDGKVSSLKHFKNDAREVESGLECGVGVEGYNDLKMGDVIEFYQMEEVARTLSAVGAPSRRSPAASSARAEAHP